uniref:Uncharacterized protein n=1 Tax=Solanum lycopersicum TaxID=4081 RepID=A0A3Q7FG79_SOLLC
MHEILSCYVEPNSECSTIAIAFQSEKPSQLLINRGSITSGYRIVKYEAILLGEGLTLVSVRVERKILSTRATDQLYYGPFMADLNLIMYKVTVISSISDMLSAYAQISGIVSGWLKKVSMLKETTVPQEFTPTMTNFRIFEIWALSLLLHFLLKFMEQDNNKCTSQNVYPNLWAVSSSTINLKRDLKLKTFLLYGVGLEMGARNYIIPTTSVAH